MMFDLLRRFPLPVLIALLLLAATGCFSSTGQIPEQDERIPSSAKNPRPTTAYPVERTLTAIVDPELKLVQPGTVDDTLRFTDLRNAFLALHDSAHTGHPAERFELLVMPGTYRLTRPMLWVVDDGYTQWIEFSLRPYGAGEVTISGAEIYRQGDPNQPWNDLSRWEPVDDMPDSYITQWPYAWGKADISGFNDNTRDWLTGVKHPELMLRREMVLVNGTLLKQRTLEQKLMPGTFKVKDATDDQPGWLHIQLSEPLQADDSIEIPVTQTLLTLRDFDRIEIEGIDFVHASHFHPGKAVIISGTQSARIENCGFNENNWRGLSIGNTPLPIDRQGPDTLEIINCRANGNGAMGMGFSNVARLRIEDSELAWNNWRGYSAGTDAWAVGGSKLFHCHDVTVSNLHAHHNLATGLWFDTDAERVVIEDCLFETNARDGVFIEACQGPVDIFACIFSQNARDGLRNNSSSELTVRGCRFDRNAVAHFCLGGLSRKFTSFEDGRQLHVTGQNNLFRNNQFLGEPIWYAEEWISAKKLNNWERETRFEGNACWPYDPDHPFCQRPLPEELR
ncbi:right-handed parallel beta-helix repeat-containing protein [bacterium]|nr:right-handed parallel beta-helix repeat-containing protein [bacterium]